MRALPILAVVLCLSCGPDFDRSIALLATDRILAVRAEPPESLPGGVVTYTAVAATGNGMDGNAEIVWAFCATPPAPTEDSPVSAACVAGEADTIATGIEVTLATPTDACRRFGPLGMPTQAGAAPPRPAPPDATGGFYQPLRLGWHDTVSVVRERLTCDPTGVSLDLAQAYRAARTSNHNPQLLPLVATIAGEPADLGALPPRAAVDLVASWPPESVESYVTLDAGRATLDWASERLWVAWFVTAGALAADVSQAAPIETTAGNRLTVPGTPGTFYLWAILHDDRGGTDFATVEMAVR
jgi:hypothetical protein